VNRLLYAAKSKADLVFMEDVCALPIWHIMSVLSGNATPTM
jgi:hypothetical protein